MSAGPRGAPPQCCARAKGSTKDLAGANLAGCELERANLTDADLINADLYGVKLIGANLTDANLDCASLAGVNMMAANLDGTNLNCVTGWGSVKSKDMIRNLDKAKNVP